MHVRARNSRPSSWVWSSARYVWPAVAALQLTCAPAPAAPPRYPHAPEHDVIAEPVEPVRDDTKLWADAQSVFERRCVVCHGCYDAPCQLKLESFEGIARGASERRVYDSTRLTAAEPSRLFVDAHGAAAWREKGFHPVLVEQPTQDPRAGVILRMLELKHQHPWPTSGTIADAFPLGLERDQVCSKAEDFDAYEKQHPFWGMPYAMRELDAPDDAALRAWVAAGAPHPEAAPPSGELTAAIARWEDFFNQPSLKARLVARYIYEHLFLASLYFEGIDDHRFFRLVRSSSPVGSPVAEIATRRPFDDPGPGVFYYRLVLREEAPLAKTQMPYALNDARLARYRELFIEPDYSVSGLPSYEPEVSANPFRAFAALPAASRYRFMLDEAQFTLMGFIKGPVCRGQIALNVIQDRFWIAFIAPSAPWLEQEAAFLSTEKADLDLPAEAGSNALPTRWFGYAREHARYSAKRNQLLQQIAQQKPGLTLDTIWDGRGSNRNAALTVFRHFDSASVVHGFVGAAPKTTWVLSYPVLERIHYLLVAGFDVFGNVGHQLTTRLYMDFLRMEAESNFLVFLPEATRTRLVHFWYRAVSKDAAREIDAALLPRGVSSRIRYRKKDPERELLSMLQARLARVSANERGPSRFEDGVIARELERLERVHGQAASLLPETSYLAIDLGQGKVQYASILRESAHKNVAELFDEQERRVPSEDGLAVVHGFIGAYPNALFEVTQKELGAFVAAVEQLEDQRSYLELRKRFGVSRRSDGFWHYADRMLASYRAEAPLEAGIFDFNRLEGY